MEERMKPNQRVYIQEDYAKNSTLPEAVNPVVKVCLSVWHHQTKHPITEVKPMHTGRGGPPPTPPASSWGVANISDTTITAENDNTVVTASTKVNNQYARDMEFNAMTQRPINQEFFSQFVSLHNQTKQ